MAREIEGDIPHILVSELYQKGTPCSHPIIRIADLAERGRVTASIRAAPEQVISLARIDGDGKPAQTYERSNDVEWRPWRFDSRRPWVQCGFCLKPCARLFIATRTLAGSLICGKCARVRYASQDFIPMDRIGARQQRIRERLGEDA